MPGKIFVFCGFVASGKSTIAKAFAEKRSLGYYNSDRVRKELAGYAATENCQAGYHEGIYTPQFTRRTYDALLHYAEQDLRDRPAVVLDGSYLAADERARLLELGARLQAEVVVIFCTCSPAETKKRLALRARDTAAVSDGRWEIYQKQQEQYAAVHSEMESILFDTGAPVSELLVRLEKIIG